MANGRIQGITIELDANTTGLTDALKESDKAAKDLQKELREVDQALRLDPTNVDLMAQRQEILAQSISNTSSRLDVLRQSQAQVEAQFERGDIGAEQYRAFQRELSNTESQLNSLSNQVTESAQNQQRLIQSTRDFNTLLGATGTELNDYTELLGSRLTSAIRNGTASTDQMNRAIRLVGQATTGTATDLRDLQQALRNVDNGSSLSDVREDLRQLERSAESAEDSVDGLTDSLKNAAAGLAVGGGLAAVVKESLDFSSLDTKIEITMDIPPEDVAAVRETIKSVEAYGLSAEEALEGVRRQFALNGKAGVEANQDIIKSATAIAGAYDEIDFKELIQESHEMAKTFGISQKEAIGMTQALLKVGFPPEQLDIISEYGNQLSEAGYNALEIQAIMAAGVETGTWNIDILLDGVKEGRIVMAEFGAEVDQSMRDVIEGTNISSAQLQVWGKAVAEGGTQGTIAMQEVAKAVADIDDKTKQNEVGVKVFGTLWEENGTKITDTLLNMNDHLTTSAENMSSLDEAIAAMEADPVYRMNEAMNALREAISPLLEEVGKLVAEFALWVEDNAALVVSVGALAAGLAGLLATMTLLSPIVSSILSSFKMLSATIALITSPIGLTVVALGALVAGLTYAYNESEVFRDKVNQVFTAVKEFIVPIIEEIVSFAKEQFAALTEFWDENGEMILEAVTVAWEAIQNVFETVLPIIQAVVESVWQSIQGIIEGALGVITGLIKTFAALLTGDFDKAWEAVKETFSSAVKFVASLVEVWIVGKVLGSFKTFGSALVKTVKSAADKVKELFKDMVDKIKSFFKVDEFIQLGKDVISGFVKGITGAAGAAVKAVGDVMKNVIKAAKRALDSHSPSREFIALGHDTLDGYNIGMEDREKLVTGTMTDIMGNLIDVADHYASEEQKIAKESGEKIADIEKKKLEDIQKVRDSAAKKTKTSQVDTAKQIEKITNDANKKIAEIQVKAITDSNKLISTQRKAELDEIQKFIDDKRSLNQLGILEEVAIWETASKYFEEGSNERIKSQQNYKKAVESINKEVLTTNESFTKQINTVTENFTKESEKLWDDYYNKLDATTKGIQNSLGGLDSIFKTTEVSGQDMIAAQQSQVDAMIEWRATMEGLFSRIDNDDLIKELEELGVKGLGQLKGLNALSQPELDNFVTLYEDNFRIAREIAEEQLSGSKEDVEKNIKAMKRASKDELDKLNDQWKESIRNITKNTDNELQTLEQVGVNAGNSLLSGLTSTESALTAKAKEIADSIKNTIGETLGVNMGGDESSSLPKGNASGFAAGFGAVGQALSDTKSSMNNMRSGIQRQSSANIDIGVSDIYMDSTLVGKATFKTVGRMQGNATGIEAMVKGVNL